MDINCFECSKNKNLSTFHSSLFEYGANVSVNKPIRVANKSATVIDSVITTNIFDEP